MGLGLRRVIGPTRAVGRWLALLQAVVECHSVFGDPLTPLPPEKASILDKLRAETATLTAMLTAMALGVRGLQWLNGSRRHEVEPGGLGG